MRHSRRGRQQSRTEQAASGTGRSGSGTCGGSAVGGSSSSPPSSINTSPSPFDGGSATRGGGAAGGLSSSLPSLSKTSSLSPGGGSATCGCGVAGGSSSLSLSSTNTSPSSSGGGGAREVGVEDRRRPSDMCITFSQSGACRRPSGILHVMQQNACSGCVSRMQLRVQQRPQPRVCTSPAGLSVGHFGAAIGSSAERSEICRGRSSSSFLARVPRWR